MIDGVTLPIEDSELFRGLRKRFQILFRAGGEDLAIGVTARATFIGTFFAGGGQQTKPNGDTVLTGFGHFACCSLLVIQRVEQFEEIRRLQSATPGT